MMTKHARCDTGDTSVGKMAGSETLPMSIDCPPRRRLRQKPAGGGADRSCASPRTRVTTVCSGSRNVIHPKKEEELPAATEGGSTSRRRTKRAAITTWLRGLFVAVILAGTAPPGVERRYPSGFINPTGPPEFWLLVSATMRAAAAELGIDVDMRNSERSFDKAALACARLSQRTPASDTDRHQRRWGRRRDHSSWPTPPVCR